MEIIALPQGILEGTTCHTVHNPGVKELPRDGSAHCLCARVNSSTYPQNRPTSQCVHSVDEFTGGREGAYTEHHSTGALCDTFEGWAGAPETDCKALSHSCWVMHSFVRAAVTVYHRLVASTPKFIFS